MIGRISPSNASYLITAGTDRQIRFWDFRSPDACYTVAGTESAQPRSIFVARKVEDHPVGKLFVCYSSATPSADKILQSQLPLRENRGLIAPSTNFRDIITDLKDIETPMRLLLSSSKDGEVKIWR
jgi:WD40 repeat protein